MNPLDRAARDPLLAALRQPESLLRLDAAGWSAMIYRARAVALIGRIGALCDEQGLTARFPPKVRDHLRAAHASVTHNQRQLRWEIRCLGQTLATLGCPVVLLKGAAYLWKDLPPARGRVASDVDILIDPEELGRAEAALLEAGWDGANLDAYDRYYYRTWMHELPPMQHRQRRVAVDVHHALHPPTGRLRLSTRELIRSIGSDGGHGLCHLAPADMVLHTAIHLFQDGDMAQGLRDLVDFDDLVRHFGTVASFWDAATARVADIGAGRAWFYALRYGTRFLDTPVPQHVVVAAEQFAPSWAVLALMDRLVGLVLLPPDPDHRSRVAEWARFALYVRSHWLRMPPLLLARHLARKAMKRTKL